MERRVYRYETVGSTNTELTELIRQGAAEGTVVLARQQTAGRGRMGRSFQSPLNKSSQYDDEARHEQQHEHLPELHIHDV